MIYVDDRAGSCELAEPLRQRGLDVELTRLDFGDVAFAGSGEKDEPLWIGVEFKQLSEFVASVRSERFQGFQLPGMRQVYAHSYLFIEGDLSYNERGQLTQGPGRNRGEKMHGRMTVAELLKRLFVLHLRGGINPVLLSTRRDTLSAIEALYRTWTDTPLDQHTSHIGMYSAPPLVPISPFRQAVCKWPHIGIRLSRSVEQRFGSVQRAANATGLEWADLEVVSDSGRKRRLGEKAASEIVQFLRGTP